MATTAMAVVGPLFPRSRSELLTGVIRANDALQRTTLGVTACAQTTQPARRRALDCTYRQASTPNRLRPPRLRRPPWSLSLESSGHFEA